MQESRRGARGETKDELRVPEVGPSDLYEVSNNEPVSVVVLRLIAQGRVRRAKKERETSK